MSAVSAAPVTTETRSPETWSRRREWVSYGRRNPTLVAGLTIISVIVIFGLLAPFIIDQDATRTTAFSKDLPPSLDHPLGTD
ncbi:MAG: D,D-dipeptide ABC transporter permease, partial [Chloroflexota bacterium]|nr:D,D-dipeptide ABC transporter permease [Chloroflexota bacterium]